MGLVLRIGAEKPLVMGRLSQLELELHFLLIGLWGICMVPQQALEGLENINFFQ
jgi:hypothetical protein